MKILLLILLFSVNTFSQQISGRSDLIIQAHLNEDTGTYTYNTSKTDLDISTGTISGGVWVSDCKIGACLDFNGTSDHISFSELSGTTKPNSTTMMAWIYSPMPSRYQQIIHSDGLFLGSGRNFIFDITSSHNIRSIIWTVGGIDVLSGSILSANTWHHVAVTYNSSDAWWVIYIDGKVDTARSHGYGGNLTNHSEVPYLIARTNDDANSYYFDGKIDDVMIFNRALSSGEIFDIYNYKARVVNQ